MPKFDEVGELVVYTLEEEAVANYNTTYDGYNIINSLKETPPKPEPKEELPRTGETNFLWLAFSFLSIGSLVLFLDKQRYFKE